MNRLWMVITYQTPRGEKLALTPPQIRRLEKAGIWPRNSVGEEYCTVSAGRRPGRSSLSDAEVRRLINTGATVAQILAARSDTDSDEDPC